MEVVILILIPDLESHICGVGTIFFVDVVHSKYINFPAVSKLPNYSVDTAESREAWKRWKLQGQDWQPGQVTRKALREIWQHQHQQHLRVQQEIYSPSGDLQPCLQYVMNRGPSR